jgi:hypothetical protein
MASAADSPSSMTGRVRSILNRARATEQQNIVTTVEGLVRGAPRSGSLGLAVYLSPWWRRASGQLAVMPLRVRLSAAVDLGMGLMPGTSVRIFCHNLEPPRRGSHAWTATGMKIDSGPTGAPAQVPVVVHDRVLNRVVLDPKTNLFVGERRRGELRYVLRIERSLDVGNAATDREDVLRAAQAVRHFERHAGDVRAAIAGHARDLYNDRWRHGRRQQSIAEVSGSLRLSEVTSRCDGSLELHLLAADLFYGHWLEASLDTELRLVTLRTAP